MAARNEELLRLQAQIAEREAAMPLRERIREIFKKYGVTVTSIFLATGITIRAVLGAKTNTIKTLGKNLANGLKAIGSRAALPGLIGAIVSFLFKTAAQAIGYLAKQTWLLILAAVFISQKYIKVELAQRYKQQSHDSHHANNYRSFVYFVLWGFSICLCLHF